MALFCSLKKERNLKFSNPKTSTNFENSIIVANYPLPSLHNKSVEVQRSIVDRPPIKLFYIWGILVKLVICVVPGHWKIKILNLKKRNKFICFFMFLYPIQGGKNIGSPYLTNKSWFLANLMSRDNKIKVTLVLWHPRTLFF